MPVRLSKAMTRPLFALLLTSLTLASCKKEEQVSKAAPTQSIPTDEISMLKNYVSELTGTALARIAYDEARKQFVINYNGTMPLETVKQQYTAEKANGGSAGAGRRVNYPYLMFQSVAKNIKLYYNDPAIPLQWREAIIASINAWNNADSYIHIDTESTATPAEATIVFSTYYDGSKNQGYDVALGNLSLTIGAAGNSVQLNLFYNDRTLNLKISAVAHALSHCFGFTNNDDPAGEIVMPDYVGYYPADEAFSVFHSVPNPWQGHFTFWDWITIGRVYGRTVNSNKRLLRYYSKDRGVHMYTSNPLELQAAGQTYGFEKGEGYVSPLNGDGSLVELLRYYNPSKYDHVYTTNISELGPDGRDGYRRESFVGYISPVKTANTRPLYRYHNNSKHDHFYTTDINELGATGSGGYVPENPFIIGYVF